MSIEATAEALAPETAAPVEPQEPSVQDELGAIYDKNNVEAEDQTPNEPEAEVEAQDEPSEEPTPAPEKVEIPSDIPKQLKTHWESLSEDARTAVQDFARESNRKMSEQGRLVQGIAPIRDSLVEAAKQFPQLADMKPQDVAKEVFQLAQVSANFRSKPVETILGLARQHGIEKQLSQALQGQPVQDNSDIRKIMQANESLRREIAELKDPNYIRSQVTAVTTEERTVNEVQNFAKTAEHWDKVEDSIPDLIPAVKAKLGPDAPPVDVLKAAYDLAVSWVMPEERKAPDEATEQVANIADPEKAKAVLKAKSVNVTGKPSKPRTLSAQEELAAIWDRNNK